MPTKTTTKKPKSKSGLKRRFDLTNRKVQFFVVIAIVAVLGGGYFTVRSFAATEVKQSWNANQLNCAGGKCTRTNDTTKNNMSVLRLTTTSSENAGFITATKTLVYQNTDYRICVTAKGVSALGVAIEGTKYFNAKTRPESEGYQRVCTNVMNTGPIGTSYKNVRGITIPGPSTTTNISNVELELVYNSPTLPDSPQK